MLEEGFFILYINAGLGFWLFVLRLRTIFLIKKYQISDEYSYFRSNDWRLNEFRGMIETEPFLNSPEHIQHELSIEFKLLKLLRFLLFASFIAWVGFVIYIAKT